MLDGPLIYTRRAHGGRQLLANRKSSLSTHLLSASIPSSSMHNRKLHAGCIKSPPSIPSSAPSPPPHPSKNGKKRPSPSTSSCTSTSGVKMHPPNTTITGSCMSDASPLSMPGKKKTYSVSSIYLDRGWSGIWATLQRRSCSIGHMRGRSY